MQVLASNKAINYCLIVKAPAWKLEIQYSRLMNWKNWIQDYGEMKRKPKTNEVTDWQEGVSEL